MENSMGVTDDSTVTLRDDRMLSPTSLSSPGVAGGVPGVVPGVASPAAAESRNFMRGTGGGTVASLAAEAAAGVCSLSFLSFRLVSSFLGLIVFGLGAAGLRTVVLGTTIPAKGLRHFAFPTSDERNHTGPFGRAGPSNAVGCRAGPSTASAVEPASWYF